MTTTEVTPQDAIRRLNTLAGEIAQKSQWLHLVEIALSPVEDQYTKFVEEHEVGLWRQVEASEGKKKMPRESLTLRLAHESMDPALLGRYTGLMKKRRRLEQKLRDLKAEVEAQRSILSALKVLEEVR